MKKNIIIFNIFISYFIMNCKKEIEKIPIKEEVLIQNEKIEPNTELDIENKINDSVYCYKKDNRESNFALYYSKDESESVSFDSMIIKNKSNMKTQKIKFKKDYFLPSYYAEFYEEDINFDGFMDIYFMNYNGLYNTKYSYWRFDNIKKTYKHVHSLDSIYNPVFDKSTKEIYSNWRIAFSTYYSEKYFWKNNQVVLMEQRIENYFNEDSTHIFSKKLINGRYVKKETYEVNKKIEKKP
jgi:hypothetical protein